MGQGDETTTVQGHGATVDEALLNAHNLATGGASGPEIQRTRVYDIMMTTGGIVGAPQVYVRVHLLP